MTETETKWSERVREWKASGRTAKEFAEGTDFKPSTLVYWASCLRTSHGGRPRKKKKREPRVRVNGHQKLTHLGHQKLTHPPRSEGGLGLRS